MAHSSSLEETAKSFQSKFDQMMKDITVQSLPMQKKAFECCVSCFDSHKQNPEKIAECVTQCHEESQNFNNALQREVEGLQTSIESCQKICINRATPKIESASSLQEKVAAEKENEICLGQCFTDNVSVIKEIGERLKRRL